MSWKSQWEGARDRRRGNTDMFFQLKHVAPDKRTPPGPLPSTTYSHSGFVQLMWLDLVLLFCTISLLFLYQIFVPNMFPSLSTLFASPMTCRPRGLSVILLQICSAHNTPQTAYLWVRCCYHGKIFFPRGKKFKLLKFLFCFATGKWDSTADAYRQSSTFLVFVIYPFNFIQKLQV